MEPILFPDAEQLVCDWLAPQLAARGRAVQVATSVPDPRPTEFVRIIRTGGPRGPSIVLDRPTLVIEGWADRESAASSLLLLARALVESMPGQEIAGVMVYRATEAGGPANLPDPDTGQHRYTCSVSMLLRGNPLPAP